MDNEILAVLKNQSSLIETLSEQLAGLRAEVMSLRNQSPTSTSTEWGDIESAVLILHRSRKTIDRYRAKTIEDFQSNGEAPWIQGIHYRKTGKNTSKIVYNIPLLRDWEVNRLNPAAHQKAIDKFLKNGKRK